MSWAGLQGRTAGRPLRQAVIASFSISALVLCCGIQSACAMTLHRMGDTLILSGEIVRRDLDAVQAEFAKLPAITHVVLRNSMGGNSWTGYRLGELFRERGVTTVVSGHCVSSCSRLFLGGKQRMFSHDYPASLTYVGFHGHYDFGKLNAQAVEKNDLAQWTIKFTDGKVDPKLMQRWINIERRAGDVRFYPDAVATRFTQPTMLCVGTESSRPQQCEKIATRALTQGIVTTNALWTSPDASTLPFKAREKQYPTTSFATLEQTDRLPARSASARRDFALFCNASLPRAFAVSSDGARWAWSANGPRSVELALERCEAKTALDCVLYAVDERVVYRKK
jgi:hypothetical protein